VVLQPLFETCQPNDGAMTLQVFKAGGIVTTLSLVWKVQESGNWELEVDNAAGITLMHMMRTGNAVSTDGPAAARLPQVTILKDGFLAVNGEPVGLKAGELPCVLGYRLPRSWLALTASVETAGRVSTVEMRDERRRLTVTVKDAAKGADAVCTQISWTKYLVFHTHLHWCQTPDSRAGSAVHKRQAVLSGIDDYQLKWVSADE
jgi:hypothetical protein